jgi:hypothetical protein
MQVIEEGPSLSIRKIVLHLGVSTYEYMITAYFARGFVYINLKYKVLLLLRIESS